MNDEVLKLCCTAVYKNAWTKLLLDDSFHHLDFAQAKSIARHAAQAVRQGKLGYALLIGEQK